MLIFREKVSIVNIENGWRFKNLTSKCFIDSRNLECLRTSRAAWLVVGLICLCVCHVCPPWSERLELFSNQIVFSSCLFGFIFMASLGAPKKPSFSPLFPSGQTYDPPPLSKPAVVEEFVVSDLTWPCLSTRSVCDNNGWASRLERKGKRMRAEQKFAMPCRIWPNNSDSILPIVAGWNIKTQFCNDWWCRWPENINSMDLHK